MRKLIHRLRGKSEEARRRILHVSIFIATVVMLMLWVFSLGTTLTDEETKLKIKQDMAPFSALKDNLTDGYSTSQE